MIDFFHRAKHWMLFIPLALPTIIQYSVQGSVNQKMQKMQLDMIKNPEMGIDLGTPDMSEYATYWYVYVALMAVSFLVVMGWYWSIGYGLKNRLPTGVNLDIGKFRIGFIALAATNIGIIVALFFSFGYLNSFLGMIMSDTPPDFATDPDFPATFLKIWLTAMIGGLLYLAAFLYVAIFSARTLRSIEMGKRAGGSELIGYVFLMFIPLIGVWILQPKINRLVITGTTEKSDDSEVW